MIQHNVLLAPLLEQILTEKRMQYRGKGGIKIQLHLDPSCYGQYVSLVPSEFQRIISNLINNSVEAMDEIGEIQICLSQEKQFLMIRIVDSGKGMAPECLQKLGEKGFSLGKNNGNGYGFYFAKTTVESWGGKIDVKSVLNVGTEVYLALPLEQAPMWLAQEILISSSCSTIIIIDDDQSVHQMWYERFAKLKEIGRIQHILSYSSLTDAKLAFHHLKEEASLQDKIFLVDYEFLGEEGNGLDFICEMKLEKNAYLVTSRFEENSLQENASKNHIKIVPKNFSRLISLVEEAVSDNSKAADEDYFEYVYIEDDQLLRLFWETRANAQGKKLLLLNSTHEFFKFKNQIHKEKTKIYLDSDLGPADLKGEEFAQKLYDEGHKNIFMATGHEKEHFEHLPWLQIAGKNCPF